MNTVKLCLPDRTPPTRQRVKLGDLVVGLSSNPSYYIVTRLTPSNQFALVNTANGLTKLCSTSDHVPEGFKICEPGTCITITASGAVV